MRADRAAPPAPRRCARDAPPAAASPSPSAATPLADGWLSPPVPAPQRRLRAAAPWRPSAAVLLPLRSPAPATSAVPSPPPHRGPFYHVCASERRRSGVAVDFFTNPSPSRAFALEQVGEVAVGGRA